MSTAAIPLYLRKRMAAVKARYSWAKRRYGDADQTSDGSPRMNPAFGRWGVRRFYGPNAGRKAARDLRRGVG